jgi:hypothetical protein
MDTVTEAQMAIGMAVCQLHYPAIWASVTVSIGDDTNGALRVIFLVRAEVKS